MSPFHILCSTSFCYLSKSQSKASSNACREFGKLAVDVFYWNKLFVQNWFYLTFSWRIVTSDQRAKIVNQLSRWASTYDFSIYLIIGNHSNRELTITCIVLFRGARCLFDSRFLCLKNGFIVSFKQILKFPDF